MRGTIGRKGGGRYKFVNGSFGRAVRRVTGVGTHFPCCCFSGRKYRQCRLG